MNKNKNNKLRFFICHFLFLVGLFGISSCDVINPEEDVPAFIHVKPFTVATNPTLEGTASAKITEVWVFNGSDYLGAYPLPATVPLLLSGETNISLKPGIKDNGISSLPEIYEFYKSYDVVIDLVPGQTDTIRPSTSYDDNVIFEFIEDFESPNHIFSDDIDGVEETQIVTSSDDVFEGNRSGKIVLTKDFPEITVATNINRTFKDLQKNSVFVYLEVNYKSDVDVIWGIAAHPNAGNSLDRTFAADPGFTARDSWNKIYFNLSQLLFDNQEEAYQILLSSVIPIENGELTLDEAVIYLDNIKLIHF